MIIFFVGGFSDLSADMPQVLMDYIIDLSVLVGGRKHPGGHARRRSQSVEMEDQLGMMSFLQTFAVA